MAPPARTYVQVSKFAVKDLFDPQYKAKLPGIMENCAEKVVKKSAKLTLDQPKDKGAKGYTLDGSLVSLGPDKTGKKLGAQVSLAISTWPGKSIKAMPSGGGALPIDDISKVDAGDVQAVVEGAVASAMAEAVKYMEKTPP
ncbi:MAG TPA: hypothetical protein VKS60_05690 [Stellaceae bacterium]|nr:hypothetical protein [Stellaceae bacterium]